MQCFSAMMSPEGGREGTSARRTRRRALAMAASTPTISNSSSSSLRQTHQGDTKFGEGGREEERGGEREVRLVGYWV